MRLLIVAICFLQTVIGFTQLSVSFLQIENRTNPLGVDNLKPALSWQLESTQKNVLQTAYRVLVANDPKLLDNNSGNIWDSKKIKSSSSIQVSYSGKALQPAKKYFWKVIVWDNKGNVSSWSETASWQMGLPAPADWTNAKWIGYEEINDTAIIAPHMHQSGKKAWGARRNILPLLRKSFTINKPVKRATAFISGLGHFELYVNGEKSGDHFLDPGWTNYKKHAQYVSFDITGQLTQRDNAFGVMLGNGFYYIPGQRYRKMTGAYGLPKMIMRAVIEYEDGTTESIISDNSWKTSPSPIIFSSIFGGEDYDAMLEQTGWNKRAFNDEKWKNAVLTDAIPLESQMTDPVKIMMQMNGRLKASMPDGSFVYDFNQNFSGIPAIVVSGRAGDTVRIIPGELVNDDGSVNQRATGSPSYFTYILKGGEPESWQPRFTYYGFRYAQVYCIAAGRGGAKPAITSIRGLHIRNSMSTVGAFNCGYERFNANLFNRIDTLIDWAIRSNTVSVFTDCPHREKLGWLEQTQLMGASIHYKYDIAALNKKVIRDMKFAQYPDGHIPEIAPEYTKFTPPFDESPEWGSAAIILPWYNYQWYGDKETLEQSYEMMKHYLAYLDTKDTNDILTHGLGDWYDIGPNRPGFSQMTRPGVTATATWFYDLSIMQKIATVLNKKADIAAYRKRGDEIRKAFNKRFFDPVQMEYDSGSQTANAMALFMGLAEPEYREAVADALVKDIASRANALTAGDIGFRYVLRALEDAGRSDVIFNMNERDDTPGYGYQLKNGATALTESWQALPNVSNNHLMLGHLMEWFYAGLCGIKLAVDGVAYNRIEIRPQPVGDIRDAYASFRSPYGKINVSWYRDHDLHGQMRVTIPVNTTAVVYVPGSKKGINVGSGVHEFEF